tara:strand:+ start:91 stop:192 length:102 start_codon:yes stop_codon:yes gene_type:complete
MKEDKEKNKEKKPSLLELKRKVGAPKISFRKKR